MKTIKKSLILLACMITGWSAFSQCLISSSIAASPAPVSGQFAPGQRVEFCYTVTSWDQVSSNWFHGVQPTFGAGWDTSTLSIISSPAGCDGQGLPTDAAGWSWYPSGVTSSASSVHYGKGWYYLSSAPNSGSGGPGNSYGDNCTAYNWVFCLSVTSRQNITASSDLSVTFRVTADGQSGGWTSAGCANDTPKVFHATGGGVCTVFDTTISPSICIGGSYTFGSRTLTQPGLYVDTLTSVHSGCDSIVNLNLSINTTCYSPGPNQTICQYSSTHMAAAGPGTWSAMPTNPVTVTIDTPSSAATPVSGFTAAGVYSFIWTTALGSDTMSITVEPKPNAGPDQNLSCVALPGGSVTMAATGTGTWTMLPSNPSAVVITTPTSPTTTITGFSAAGTYAFIWTNASGCSDTADVIVSGMPTFSPRSQTIGSIQDTAFIAVTGVSAGSYSITAFAANPATASANTSSSTTAFITTFGTPGTYNFVCTTTCNTDTVTVIVGNGCNSPYDSISYVNLSGDRYLFTAYTASPHPSLEWSDDASSYYTRSGTDTITLTLTPGVHSIAEFNLGCSTKDSVSINVPACNLSGSIALGNHASSGYDILVANISGGTGQYNYVWTFNPLFNYGSGLYIENNGIYTVSVTDTSTGCYILLSDTVTNLACSVQDPIEYQYLGNGNYHFWTPMTGSSHPVYNWQTYSTLSSDSSFNAILPPGFNAIYLNVRDSVTGCNNFDSIYITVPAYYSGGPDQTVCRYHSTYMAASGTGTWTAVSGNPTVAGINNPSSPTTYIVGFDSLGVYGFIWNMGSSIDTVYVTVVANPNAGPDQTALVGGSATMAATGAGLWSAYPGNPGSSLINAINMPNTTIDNFSAAGTYMYFFTNNNGCQDTADVVVSASCFAHDSISYVYLGNGRYLFTAHASSATPSLEWSDDASSYYTRSGTDTISLTLTPGVHSIAEFNLGCSTEDSVSINVPPYTGPAGPDQVHCINGLAFTADTVVMAATGTGTWSTLPDNPHNNTIIDSPSSPTTLIYAYPFMAGTYGFVWTTAAGPDTVYVTLDSIAPVFGTTVSFAAVCSGSSDSFSVSTMPGDNSLSYAWYLDNALAGTTQTYVAASLSTGDHVSVVVTSSLGCVNNHLGSDTLSPAFTVSNCGPDSTVWPGDADANHVVDNNDLLAIGLAYDSSGPARAPAAQGIVWQADHAADWIDTLPGYTPRVNFKNADCNGNGFVDATDTLAIITNFSLTHAKTGNLPAPWRNGIPGLTLSLSKDTVYNGDTLYTNIYLGDSALPVTGIYGLAFTFNYQGIVIDSTQSGFSFVPSWLGNSSNSINIAVTHNSQGTVQAAITGIDHLPRSGNGLIATTRGAVTTDNINGKTYSYFHNVEFISDVRAIDIHGNPIPLNDGIDSDYVGFFTNNIRNVAAAPEINIYPNPASGTVRITSGAAITAISITDMLGEIVQQLSVDNKLSENADLSRLADGVYTVRVSTLSGTATAKLVLSR